MSSPGMRLTRAGRLLLAKALTGKELKFLYVEIGDGDFDYDTESVADLETLRSTKMTLPLTKVVVQGDGTCYVQAHLSNAEVYDGFRAKEHGVFARDPDSGEDILFSYRNAGDDYDFIPANTASAAKNLYLEYIVEIQDAENVTALLDLSVAYVGEEEFQKHIESNHPHPNIPNHYGSVTSTNAIWVTNEDNHMYQMAVGDMKALLFEDSAIDGIDVEEEPTVLSEAEQINQAKAELGLNANMLIVEDFKNPDTADMFKVRVTSSAENGLLLGVESIDGLKSGAQYLISDGINQEFVKVSSIVYNISGIHVRLSERLTYAYDWEATYLYRTAYSGAEKASLKWEPYGGFVGTSANIARTITLNTSVDKMNDFDIEGDGYLTVDGYFTLGV